MENTPTNEQEMPPTVEQQLAEAEERGYRRGLNEQIAARMQEPGVWEGNETPAADRQPEEGYHILDSLPRSIWEA